MPIDRKRDLDPATAHQREADVVDEADRAPAGSQDRGHCCSMCLGIDPLDRHDRKQGVVQRDHRGQAEAPLHERQRLDEHVVVGDELRVLVQDTLKRPGDPRMRGVVAVQQREERRSVDEDRYAP